MEIEIKAHYTVACPAERIEGGSDGAKLYNKVVDLEECKKCPYLINWSVGKLEMNCSGEGEKL